MASRSKPSRALLLAAVLLGIAPRVSGSTAALHYTIRVVLPTRIQAVSSAMGMEQKIGNDWRPLLRVVHCQKKCEDSRIADDVILPAIAGPRTKSGATYSLYFKGLRRGTYRFIVSAYDSGAHPEYFRSKTYTLGKRS